MLLGIQSEARTLDREENVNREFPRKQKEIAIAPGYIETTDSPRCPHFPLRPSLYVAAPQIPNHHWRNAGDPTEVDFSTNDSLQLVSELLRPIVVLKREDCDATRILVI